MAATQAAPFAQELQALKAELQRTLARLGGVTTANDGSRRRAVESPTSPWSRASATTSTTTTTTPTTVRSDATSARSEASPAHSDTTARILYELVATARRRRQVEMHMARELERESRLREEDRSVLPECPRERMTSARDAAVDARETAIRGEIEALRRRRKQILHEIDNESKAEDHDEEEDVAPRGARGGGDWKAPNASELPAHTGPNLSNLSASIKRQSEHEYSIEGTVKLGHVLAVETRQAPAMRQPSVPAIPQAHLFTGFAPAPSSYAHSYRPPHHDTMQDVFALQLKFAETMLQLEKSIQARDEILIPAASSSRRRRTTTATLRRRARPPSTIHEERERDPADSSPSDEDNSAVDSHPMALSSSDDASLSEDTMRLWRRYRLDGRPTHRRTTHTRSSANMAASVATTTTSTSPNSQPSPTQVIENSATTGISPPVASSPMEEHPTTPSTNDSNKQVRFHETEAATDDYPTPLVARNISFDQDSIDSSDDEGPATTAAMRRSRMQVMAATHRPAPQAPRNRVVSVVSSDDETLSFLDGSSVCSADLHDESFLAAFYALRKELQGDRFVPITPSPAKPQPGATGDLHVAPVPVNTTRTQQDTAAAVDLAALKQQKRGLTLDIQSLTATLVLAQDATQRAQASSSLERLRRQLRTIEAQETVAASA